MLKPSLLRASAAGGRSAMSWIDMGAQMGPDYMILLNDEDITGNFRSRLISLLIDDKRGMEADVLTLELDDSEWHICQRACTAETNDHPPAGR